jgi:hypothetical protein
VLAICGASAFPLAIEIPEKLQPDFCFDFLKSGPVHTPSRAGERAGVIGVALPSVNSGQILKLGPLQVIISQTKRADRGIHGAGRPVSSGGGSRQNLPASAATGNPLGDRGASVSTVRLACSVPASEAVTASQVTLPTTHHFLDTLKFIPSRGVLLALGTAAEKGDDRVSKKYASQHCDFYHNGNSGFGGNADSAEIVIGALGL